MSAFLPLPCTQAGKRHYCINSKVIRSGDIEGECEKLMSTVGWGCKHSRSNNSNNKKCVLQNEVCAVCMYLAWGGGEYVCDLCVSCPSTRAAMPATVPCSLSLCVTCVSAAPLHVLQCPLLFLVA